jgi:starch phosphorylase
LWEAKPIDEFDLKSFNDGAYVDAILAKQRAEAITAVLYPNDNTAAGKELRLKQQYFFVAASIMDIVKRFKETHSNFADLPSKAAIQMNDTHPTIAVPELMRILVDIEGLSWEAAWDITYRTVNFTNHTVMPEVCLSAPCMYAPTMYRNYNLSHLNNKHSDLTTCYVSITNLFFSLPSL